MTMANSYYNGSADEESRQHYTTVRIQEWQRYAPEPCSFEMLLLLFRGFGVQYDQGYRLRHLEDSAA